MIAQENDNTPIIILETDIYQGKNVNELQLEVNVFVQSIKLTLVLSVINDLKVTNLDNWIN